MFHQILGLFWGILIGFGTAVPIGPVGIICVQRTLTKNRLTGLVTGLGAALSDGFLAAVGAFGIKFVSDFIFKEATILRLVGGLVMIGLGLAAIVSKPKRQVKKKRDSAITMVEHFLSAVVLTVTNPLTAITFFVAFVGIGPKLGIGGSFVAPDLVVGVFIGSCLWWLLLTYITGLLGHKIKENHLQAINRWFGAVIAVLGVIILAGTIIK